MDYNLQLIEVEDDDAIKTLLDQKLKALSDKYNWVIKADVTIKKEPKEAVHSHICKIKLSGPGPLLYASSKAETAQLAISENIRDLDTQLNKRKDIMNVRKGSTYKSI